MVEYLLVQLVATMGLSAFDLTLVTVDAVKTGALPSVSGRIRRGIGLYMVQRILQQHNSYCEACNTENGVKFFFTI